jgi:hypothetical protein
MSKALRKRIQKMADAKVTVTGKRRDDLVKAEVRRTVRYWCYRHQTEAAGGASADDAPTGFRKYFEAQDLFSNWSNFAVKWDVAEDDPFTLVRRGKSVWKEWDEELVRYAPIHVHHVER